MKKFFTLLAAAAFVLTAGAAGNNGLKAAKSAGQTALEGKVFVAKTLNNPAIKAMDRTAQATARKAPRKAEASLIELPASATPENYVVDADASAFFINGSSGWRNLTASMSSVKVAIEGNDVYIQGLAYWFKDAWIKGELSGSTITFPAMTFVGEDEYGAEYLVGSTDEGETVSDYTFSYDAESKTISLDSGFYLFEADEDVSGGVVAYTYWSAFKATEGEIERPDVVEVPADLETEAWTFGGVTYSEGKPVSFSVQIGFDGDDVYIQGLANEYYLPNAWVKGTLSDGVITIPTGQYLGAALDTYDLYVLGYSDGISDITLNVSEDGNTLTANEMIVINGLQSTLYYYEIYQNGVFVKRQIVPAVPATPRIDAVTKSELGYGYYVDFTVPSVDVDGNPLFTNYLSYQLFYDINRAQKTFVAKAGAFEKLEEDMEIFPYSFTDNWDIYIYSEDADVHEIYLNDDENVEAANKIGIKSIYTVGDVTNESEIAWFDLKDYTYAVVGKFVDWDPSQAVEFEADEDGVLSANIDVTGEGEDLEFKVISPDDTAENGYMWFGGIDENQVGFFLFTEELEGVEIDLIDGANFRLDKAGNYTIIVSKKEQQSPAAGAPARAQADENLVIKVVANQATAVNDIKAGDIVSVKYVNMAGQVSNVPFDGVNVRLTTGADGSVKATKVIR